MMRTDILRQILAMFVVRLQNFIMLLVTVEIFAMIVGSAWVFQLLNVIQEMQGEE